MFQIFDFLPGNSLAKILLFCACFFLFVVSDLRNRTVLQLQALYKVKFGGILKPVHKESLTVLANKLNANDFCYAVLNKVRSDHCIRASDMTIRCSISILLLLFSFSRFSANLHRAAARSRWSFSNCRRS